MPKTPSIGLDQNQEGKFIDRYWGRVPKFIHRIPEAYICEVNPDYLELINMFIDGIIDKQNLSAELYKEIYSFADLMCSPCHMTQEDQALLRAYEYEYSNGEDEVCPEPECYAFCNESVCCGEVFSCKCVISCI